MLVCSGFLSESDPHTKSWEHLVSLCRKSNTAVYSVRWEAKTYGVMEDVALD